METLSVYDLALEALKARGTPAPRVDDERLAEPTVSSGSTMFTGRVPHLLHWCRTNEHLVVSQELRDAEVWAGFERLSRARGAADRYARMAEVAASVRLVGLPDATLSVPGAEVVPVRSGPLLGEWFLVVHARGYKGLLAARDQGGSGSSRAPGERRFEGVVTYAPGVVRAAREALEEAAGPPGGAGSDAG